MYAPRNASELDPAVLSEFQYLSSKLKAWAAVGHNEDGSHRVVSAESTNRLVGELVMWGTGTAPSKWLLCDGTAVSRTTYQSLFELWGTTFGSGDGSTTFNLPDFRQKFPLGKASSGTGNTLGATGGSIDHTHSFSGGTTGSGGGFSASTSTDGSHTHSQGAHQHAISGVAQAAAGSDVTVRATSTQVDIFSDSGTGSAGSHSHSVSVGDHTHSLGSGSTGATNPPFLAINFIVFAGV